MKKANVTRLAGTELGRNAVEFDSNLRWNDQVAWPFFYPFIPNPYQETDPLNNGLGLMGFELEPGEVKRIPVLTERDSAYSQINCKIVANRCNVDTPVAGASTITVVALNTTINSAAAAFAATDVGRKISYVDNNGNRQENIVATFVGATQITVATAPPTAARAGTAFSFSNAGTVAVAATGAVTGTNTVFTTDYAVGARFSYTDVNGLERCGTVLAIASDTAMTIDPTQWTSTAGAHSRTKWEWFDNRLPQETIVAGAGGLTTAVGVATVTAPASFVAADVGRILTWRDDNGVWQSGTITVFNAANSVDVTPVPQSVTTALPFSFTVLRRQIGTGEPSVPTPGLEYVYTPLTRFIEVKCEIPSLDDRVFFGDALYDSATGLTARPLPVICSQGINDGQPMLRTPDALIPAEGTLIYEVTNNFTQPIFINGVVFGYKIALDSDVGA